MSLGWWPSFQAINEMDDLCVSQWYSATWNARWFYYTDKIAWWLHTHTTSCPCQTRHICHCRESHILLLATRALVCVCRRRSCNNTSISMSLRSAQPIATQLRASLKKRSRIHPENVTPSLRLKLLVWRAICRLCFVRANTGKWGSTAMAHAMRQQHMEKRLRIPSTQSHTEHSHQFDSCMFRHLRDQMNADGVIHRARHIIQNASVCLCAVCLRCVLIVETSIYSLQFTLITKRTTSQVTRAIINVSLMDLTSDWWGGGIQDIAEWAKIYLNTHRKCGAQLVLTSISSNQ